MAEGNIRHMYPGGNTPLGFFSYYRYVIDSQQANRIFVLKGGPGTGKSTLMKKIGLELARQGYDIEFMHCSSDNNSLDGVVIPRLSVAVIDGTAPHMVDPVYPGAVDEIINLGQYWKVEGIRESRNDIIRVNNKIKENFRRAYRYLHTASLLMEDTEAIFEQLLDRGREWLFIHELKQTLFGQGIPSKTPGRQRCLFAAAITPHGFKDYLDSLCSGNKTIRLYAPAGSSTGRILESLKDEAIIHGYDIETYFCPMSPHRIEHIVIPALKVSVITANEYQDISEIISENCTTYNMNDFFDGNELKSYEAHLYFNRLNTDTLIQKAVESIASAKACHDELEKYYIKNMDFDELTEVKEMIIRQALEFA
jgi:hypothetical protein